MRNHGLKNRNECEFWGWNSRLDEIQAAIGNLKLKHLDDWNERYMKIARYYIRELEQCLIVPKCEEKEKPVFHRFIVQHEERDRLKDLQVAAFLPGNKSYCETDQLDLYDGTHEYFQQRRHQEIN